MSDLPPEPPRAKAVASFGRVSATSAAMRRLFAALTRLARTEITVTLIGETGTGKDVLAHAIHSHSQRASAPFVVLDCGAVATNLVESELLGHERGAFTGATSAYAGAFEQAHGGTLFLDEVGELPLDLQTRLLRVLENRRVRRVGGTGDRSVDVRVIAATNRELELEVTAGRFRSDLYFRLGAAIVHVPPLRDRLEDLPLLVPQLLADLGHPELSPSEAVLESLRVQPWPGNVRQLKNALSYAVAFVDHDRLELDDLQQLPQVTESSWLERLPLAGFTLERIERAAIKQTMAQHGGNKMQAARSLGIAVSTLYEKLKRSSSD